MLALTLFKKTLLASTITSLLITLSGCNGDTDSTTAVDTSSTSDTEAPIASDTSLTASTVGLQCDFTINSYHLQFDGTDATERGNVITTKTANDDGKFVVEGGDVICMDGSVSYGALTWKNIHGTPAKPVIIKNINGRVKIRSVSGNGYGWMIAKSRNFKILGTGDPEHRYGFKLTTWLNGYLKMVGKTTDFEVSNMEIAGEGDIADKDDEKSGFAGMMIKSQPICRDWYPKRGGGSTDAENFEMKNVYIHDNYIHDVAGEGIYAGYGFAEGKVLSRKLDDGTIQTCDTVNFPHFINNIEIYNNIVKNVGWDGIQVKNAHKDAKIYNNVISGYGIKKNGNHDEGLFVGDGSEAEIYGNWIEGGDIRSNGMQINAFGDTKIHNNVVLGQGFHGLYLNNRVYAQKEGDIEIYNNTIQMGSQSGITAYTSFGKSTLATTADGIIKGPRKAQGVSIRNNILFGLAVKRDKELNAEKDKNGDVIMVPSVEYIKIGPKLQEAIRDNTPQPTVDNNTIETDTSQVGFNNYPPCDTRPLRYPSLGCDIQLTANASSRNIGFFDIDNMNMLSIFKNTDYSGSPRINNKDELIDRGALEHGSTVSHTDVSVSIIQPALNRITMTNDEQQVIKVDFIDKNNKVKDIQYMLNGKFIGHDLNPSVMEHPLVSSRLNQGANSFYAVAVLYGGQKVRSRIITIDYN